MKKTNKQTKQNKNPKRINLAAARNIAYTGEILLFVQTNNSCCYKNTDKHFFWQ